MTASQSPNHRAPAALLLDFDGTLADTERLHYRTLVAVLERFDIDLSWEHYCEAYLGDDDATLFRHAFADAGRDVPSEADVAAMVDAKTAAFDAALDEEDVLYPGIADWLRRQAEQRPLAIFSMASRPHVVRPLRRAGLMDCFVAIVTAEDVAHGKPHPQGYQMALSQINKQRQRDGLPKIHAEDCTVIEDSSQGVAAGKAAGMFVVAVTTTNEAAALNEADAVVGATVDWG